MGSVKLELSKVNLPDRELHNSRMFIDLAENIHIHHREFRTVFSLNEFLEYCNILDKSKVSVLEYLENNVNYKEGKYPTTLFIAGGKERQLKYLQNSPKPHESNYFNNRLTVELQDEFITDEIHLHYRDFRIAMNRNTFKEFAKSISDANIKLTSFEENNSYNQKKHSDRIVNQNEIKVNYNNSNVKEIKLESIKSFHFDNIYSKDHENKTINRLSKLKNKEFVPIILSTEKNGDNYIIDGHHRYFAAKKLKHETIKALILNITFDESEDIRVAEVLLKNFDIKTNYKYGISDYWALYLSYKTNKFYYRDFDRKILKRSLVFRILRKIKEFLLN